VYLVVELTLAYFPEHVKTRKARERASNAGACTNGRELVYWRGAESMWRWHVNTLSIIKSQYHAALSMLQQVVANCPDAVWLSVHPTMGFWRVAFHALFYTHLYLQPAEKDFAPWRKHRDESQYLGPLPWPPHDEPRVGEPYSREEVLEYLDFVRTQVDDRVDQFDLAGESGFFWLPFSKLELQMYNIRHVQQHTGELSQRLAESGVEIDWVGAGRGR
jgi:hypothetical protein